MCDGQVPESLLMGLTLITFKKCFIDRDRKTVVKAHGVALIRISFMLIFITVQTRLINKL